MQGDPCLDTVLALQTVSGVVWQFLVLHTLSAIFSERATQHFGKREAHLVNGNFQTCNETPIGM